MPTADVKLGERHRCDLGDTDAMAPSVRDVPRLHSPIVTSGNISDRLKDMAPEADADVKQSEPPPLTLSDLRDAMALYVDDGTTAFELVDLFLTWMMTALRRDQGLRSMSMLELELLLANARTQIEMKLAAELDGTIHINDVVTVVSRLLNIWEDD